MTPSPNAKGDAAWPSRRARDAVELPRGGALGRGQGGPGGTGGPSYRQGWLKMGENKKAPPLMGTPVWFCRDILKLKPYQWQENVLWDVALARKPVALVAANGSGKTQNVAAPLILWHCATFPKSQVVTTAGVFRQVKEQLWSALKGHQNHLGMGWEFNQCDLTSPNGSRAVGFSTDDAGKFEGWHNQNLLMIVDEAKSVPDDIFQAIERCQPTRLLLMSSAGGCDGEFAAAFSTRRKFYSQHRATSMDCAHLSDVWIAGQIAKWGRDHPLVRSMIFSEFNESAGSAVVLGRTTVAACLDNPPAYVHGPRVAFIDWAAGGDENVVAIVAGNRLERLICWRDKDTMQAAARAVSELRRWEVPLSNIFADDSGLGHPINDALAQAGFPVRRLINGATAQDTEHYMNMGAELWFTAVRRIERKEVILLDDETLLEQLTGRKKIYSPQGKMGLEKKTDMRARGLSSPDRADAALAAIALAYLTTGGYGWDSMSDTQTDTVPNPEQGFLEAAGLFAG